MIKLNSRQKQILIITGSVAAVLLVGWAISAVNNHLNNNKKGTTDFTNNQGYFDPNSHQTVSSPSGKTPDKYGAITDAPIYLGTDALLNNGLTATQVGDYKFAIYQYFKSANIKTSEVSIAVATVVVPPWDPNSTSTTQTISFNVVVDRKTTYRVQVDYFDLDSIDLKLADNSDKALYDSGTVSNQNIY